MSESAKVVDFLIDAFENNKEIIRSETGRTLNRELSRAALIQILVYWYKLKDVANSVTETEVRLVLADQETDSGTKFNIEGVIDLVQDDEGYFMYDLKSIDRATVLDSLADFTQQLSLYAHIWDGLRDQKLSGASIITTALPSKFMEEIKPLIDTNEFTADLESKILDILSEWEPVVDVDLSGGRLERFIDDFKSVVDSIENGEFCSPPAEKLLDEIEGTGRKFGSLVCRKCDARYSCNSYRKHISDGKTKAADLFRVYWPEDDETEEGSVASLLYDD